MDWDTHWYGRDCTYPSSGWKASAAHGVGTIMLSALATEVEMRDYVRLTDPFVMWLVNILVHAGMMFQAMNPVDTNVIESHVQD